MKGAFPTLVVKKRKRRKIFVPSFQYLWVI